MSVFSNWSALWFAVAAAFGFIWSPDDEKPDRHKASTIVIKADHAVKGQLRLCDLEEEIGVDLDTMQPGDVHTGFLTDGTPIEIKCHDDYISIRLGDDDGDEPLLVRMTRQKGEQAFAYAFCLSTDEDEEFDFSEAEEFLAEEGLIHVVTSETGDDGETITRIQISSSPEGEGAKMKWITLQSQDGGDGPVILMTDDKDGTTPKRLVIKKKRKKADE